MVRSLFRWLSFAERRTRALAALFLMPVLLLSPIRGEAEKGTLLADILDRGVLRVATLNSPTTYYQGREGPAGVEYDLAAAFADDLGVEVEMVVKDTIAEVLVAADEGDVDLAAAGLTITEERLLTRRFAPSYDEVREVVVCREGGPAPGDLDTLADAEIVVAEASSFAATLQGLAAEGRAVDWREEPGASVERLLERVSAGEVACTLADDHQLDLNHRYFPGLVKALELPGERRLAWAVADGRSWRSASLENRLRRWFARRATRTLVTRLDERYYGFDPEGVEPAHAAAFRRAMERTLPRYRTLFETEAARVDMPWTLLAAVAYQESHWNPTARSPTGVRGMMMLTLPTARQLGVTNRLDLTQSTRGGARYLRRLRDRLPETIEGEQRWWFAAASYNLGWGHVMDARALTARLGKDPNQWSDVRDALPLLEDPAYHADLRYGYARGREGQLYVRRIRDFADMLEKRYDVDVERDAGPDAEGEAGAEAAASGTASAQAPGADDEA